MENDTGTLHVWTMEHRLDHVWTMAAMKLASCNRATEHTGIIDECIYLAEQLYDAVYHGGMVRELPAGRDVRLRMTRLAEDAGVLRDNLAGIQRSDGCTWDLSGLIHLASGIQESIRHLEDHSCLQAAAQVARNLPIPPRDVFSERGLNMREGRIKAAEEIAKGIEELGQS
jgi:hypothetical protein